MTVVLQSSGQLGRLSWPYAGDLSFARASLTLMEHLLSRYEATFSFTCPLKFTWRSRWKVVCGGR